MPRQERGAHDRMGKMAAEWHRVGRERPTFSAFSRPKSSWGGFPCGEPMRACWAVTLLVLVQPSPACCATCRGTSVVPRVLALAHRHLRKSPSVRQPFVEISGSISFSPPWFLSRKLCPIFVCHFKGSLQVSSTSSRPLRIRMFTEPLLR